MNKIIDGKSIAEKIEQEILEKRKTLSKDPQLQLICIGNDPASKLYTRLKSEKALRLGIECHCDYLNENDSYEKLIDRLQGYSDDSGIDGVVIQLPVPPLFLNNHSVKDLLGNIPDNLDVDGLKEDSKFTPAVVNAVLTIIEAENIKTDKLIAIVGSEGAVGKRITKQLNKIGFKVMEIDQNTKFSLKDLAQADVVISCTGTSETIKPQQIKEGSVLIDVGLGDFDSLCYEKASRYTPIKGGVGPLTIVSLLSNVIDSALNKQ